MGIQPSFIKFSPRKVLFVARWIYVATIAASAQVSAAWSLCSETNRPDGRVPSRRLVQGNDEACTAQLSPVERADMVRSSK